MYLSHGNSSLNTACYSVDARGQFEQVQGFVLLSDGIGGVYASTFHVTVLDGFFQLVFLCCFIFLAALGLLIQLLCCKL